MKNLPDSVTDLLKKIEEIENFKEKVFSLNFIQEAIAEEIEEIKKEKDNAIRKWNQEKRELLIKQNDLIDNLNKKVNAGVEKCLKNEKDRIISASKYNLSENIKLRKKHKELIAEIKTLRSELNKKNYELNKKRNA